MVGRNDLTAPITIPTTVPSPPPPSDGPQYENPASENSTIELRVCSEFTEYSAEVDYFNSGGKLQTLQDFNGEPVIFAVGENKKLNCLVHEAGKARGWSLSSISPSEDPVVAFDVVKVAQPLDDRKPGFLVVAAVENRQGFSTVYHTYVVPGADKSFDFAGIRWKSFPDPKGKKSISTLLVGVNTNRKAGQSPYLVTAGSKQQGTKAATFYVIDLTPNLPNPWIPFALDTQEDALRDIQPASVGTPSVSGESTDREDGLFVFSERLDRTDCMFYALESGTLTKTNSKSILHGSLGKVNSIFSSRNPWGFTDLLLACDKGIGFVSHDEILGKPRLVKGLPAVAFRQVVCSESIDPINQSQTVFTIFALSRENQLYYIQGTRQYTLSDAPITLVASGLPIRADVSRISCQFNAKLNSSELVYVGSGSNEVAHLLRDPVTKCWTENKIQFPSTKKTKRYKAFMTTVTVNCSDGRSVGKGFPVSITAQSTLVLVNDRSYALSTQSTTVFTNDRGQLVIIAAAFETLMAPTYSCTVSQKGTSHTAAVHGGQRVTEKLSSIKGDDGVSGARTSTGMPVFSPDDIRGKEREFKESAQLLNEFPNMMNSVQQKGTVGDGDAGGRELVLGSANTDPSESSQQVKASGDGFLDDLSEFLGDVVDWVANVAKTAFKAVFKVILGGVKIVLRIAGKVISLVIKAVGPLLNAINTFLKETLGIDFRKMFEWLGLTWDNEKTKANQAILRGGVLKFLKLPGELLKANSTYLDTLFDNLEQDLAPLIGDKSKPSIGKTKDPRSGLKNSPLAWLFDNPIINIIMKLNPLGIITEAQGEAVKDVFGDELKIPPFSEFMSEIGKILTNTFEQEAQILFDLLGKLWESLKDVANDFSRVLEILKGALQDIAHALFDSVRTAVRAIWDVMSQIMDLVVTFIDGTWKVPVITPLFEWFADQEFSIMNAFTFVVCRVLGLIVGEDNVAKYLDFNASVDDMTSTARSVNIFGDYAKPRAPAPANPTVFSRSVASTPALMSEATSKSVSGASSDKSHEEKPYHGLSADAEQRLWQYEEDSKAASTICGVFRLITIVLETVHLGTEAMQSAKVYGDTDPKLALPISALVACGLSVAGSVVNICLYASARSYSAELRLYLDEDHILRVVGLTLSLGCNLAAVGTSSAAVHYLRKGSTGVVKQLNLATALTTSVASLSRGIAVNIIPEWNHSDVVANIADVLELVATAAGMVAAGASYGKQPEVAFVACTTDGLFTLLAVLMGPIDIATHTE